MNRTCDVLVVSDFNAELVSRYISADSSLPQCSALSAPYGQVFQVLSDNSTRDPHRVALIWTRPEGVIPEFANLLAGQRVSARRLDDGVDAFAEMIKKFAEGCRYVFVASWVPTYHDRGLGLLNWSNDGAAYHLARMNTPLSEALAGVDGNITLENEWFLEASDK